MTIRFGKDYYTLSCPLRTPDDKWIPETVRRDNYRALKRWREENSAPERWNTKGPAEAVARRATEDLGFKVEAVLTTPMFL